MYIRMYKLWGLAKCEEASGEEGGKMIVKNGAYKFLNTLFIISVVLLIAFGCAGNESGGGKCR